MKHTSQNIQNDASNSVIWSQLDVIWMYIERYRRIFHRFFLKFDQCLTMKDFICRKHVSNHIDIIGVPVCTLYVYLGYFSKKKSGKTTFFEPRPGKRQKMLFFLIFFETTRNSGKLRSPFSQTKVELEIISCYWKTTKLFLMRHK